MRKSISDLVGSTITHKKYGACQVIEVTDKESFKFKAKIMNTGELKQFVFSTQFFDVEGDYVSASIKPVVKIDRDRPHKPYDYSKYRNHPLVKEIDRKEAGIRYSVIRETKEVEQDEVDDS